MAQLRTTMPLRPGLASALTLLLAAGLASPLPAQARDIAQLAAEIDEAILNQPLPRPLARLSILASGAQQANAGPGLDAGADAGLATSTLVPPSLPVPTPLVLPTTGTVDEPSIPADLEMPEAVRRDPFAPVLAPLALPATPPAAPVVHATVPALAAEEITRLKQLAQDLRRGNGAAAESGTATLKSPTARLAAEWLALRSLKQSAGFARITRFIEANPDFPMREWLLRRAEEALFIEKPSAETVLSFFAARTPEMAGGKIALARVLAVQGEVKRAEALARAAFRDDKTTASLRTAIVKEFAGAISADDQRYLAERLIYDGATSEGLKVAQAAGAQTHKLAQILAHSLNENAAAPGLIQKLDAAEAKRPAMLLARAQMLRRAGKVGEAAEVLAQAPKDLDLIVDGDEWWTERRMLARKLLDAGDPQRAYDVVAAHLAEGSAARVDAEVHAGWIALRFLKQPGTAARHFETARSAAQTPASQARAAYWQGRAAEAAGEPMAEWHHLAAAAHRHSFYGQLSRERLGLTGEAPTPPQHDPVAIEAAAKSPALSVIRALIDAEALDFAQPLAIDIASTAPTAEPVVVLGDLLTQYRQTRLAVVAGKLAMQRGLALEEHAFPTHAIPAFTPAAASAEPPIVFSIARQESEFNPRAISHAGARGLMQLMPATARRTAERNGLGFDVGKLTADPAYNVTIGAAHLAELLGEYGGNYLLSFAAYNAGGRRVKEWTTAYGDPRDPGIDKVDWIERIPITETRHYVQKVLENLQIYRARLGDGQALALAADLTRGAWTRRGTLTLRLAELPPVGAPDIR